MPVIWNAMTPILLHSYAVIPSVAKAGDKHIDAQTKWLMICNDIFKCILHEKMFVVWIRFH